jgi:hypothetical protein
LNHQIVACEASFLKTDEMFGIEHYPFAAWGHADEHNHGEYHDSQ